MGFLQLGSRSIPTRTRGANRDSNNRDSQTASHSSKAQQLDADVMTSSEASPSPAVVSEESLALHPRSPLECLPIELIQRIFLVSYNPNLPLVNRSFLAILSSPYLRDKLFVSAVLDDLSKDEYRRVMSDLISRRFFNTETLQRLEKLLWNRKFAEIFADEFPENNPTSDNTLTHLSARRRQNHQWWYRHYSHSPDKFIEGLSHKMVEGLLDLRTIKFPKGKMNPPFTFEKMEFLTEICYRAPFCYAEVSAGRAGRMACERLLEIAIRCRCAAMVYLLLNNFYVQVEMKHLRLALLPSYYGDVGYLLPEFTRDTPTVTPELDTKMIEVVAKLRSSQLRYDDVSSYSIYWFNQMIKEWKDGTGAMARKLHWKYSEEMEDSLRIFWAMVLLSSAADMRKSNKEIFSNGIGIFPLEMREEPIVKDEEVWEAALGLKGELLEWLIAVGKPPASFLSRGVLP